MGTLAIIQARMNSSRLPGKVLADINGWPLIKILIERIKKSQNINKLVVATTVNSSDDILCEWLSLNQIPFFRGSEFDVLQRFYEAASLYHPGFIVRITADDPFKDPDIIDAALDIIYGDINIDYVSNTIHPTYPEGLDVEVFRFSALDRAKSEAFLPSDREHVTPYIWKNDCIFNVRNFTMEPNLNNLRWTVDRLPDLQFARALFSLANNNFFTPYRELIAIIDRHPELCSINSGIIRNEGYQISLANDRK